MRIVAFRAAAAIEQMSLCYGVFKGMRAGVLAVAVLAGPIDSARQHGIAAVIGEVATSTADIIGSERMRRATLELSHDTGVAGTAEILLVILDKSSRFVAVHGVAGSTYQLCAPVRIGCEHARLMTVHVTTAAELSLLRQREIGRVANIVLGWLVQMVLPSRVTADTTDCHSRRLVSSSSQLVHRSLEIISRFLMAIQTGG